MYAIIARCRCRMLTFSDPAEVNPAVLKPILDTLFNGSIVINGRAILMCAILPEIC